MENAWQNLTLQRTPSNLTATKCVQEKKMMVRSLILLFLLAMIACDENDTHSDSVRIAAAKCGQSPDRMQWLEKLIDASREDPALKGNIYAMTVDGAIVIVHQPAVSSCVACVLYNCNGDRIDISTVDVQAVVTSMNASTLIYSPY